VNCRRFKTCGMRLAKGDFEGLCCLCQPAARTPGGLQPKGWPLVSTAMGVHPDQIPEAQTRAKRHGINVTYGRDGNVTIPDAGERKKLMKLDRLIDKDAFC
jgi:hypothetical protein